MGEKPLKGALNEYIPTCCGMWALGMKITHPKDWPDWSLPFGSGGLYDNQDCSDQWSFMMRVIKQDHPKSAVVYFIENYDGSRVKIGYTKTLWRRYEEISQTSGGDARIVFAIPTEDIDAAKSIERDCHKNFPGRRLGGEWFLAKDEGGSYIADFLYKTFYQGPPASRTQKEEKCN